MTIFTDPVEDHYRVEFTVQFVNCNYSAEVVERSLNCINTLVIKTLPETSAEDLEKNNLNPTLEASDLLYKLLQVFEA